MKITKLGHCCLLIEEKGLRILTDPGNYSTSQDELKNIDVILITHEHADHFHIPSISNCIKNTPTARIITNKAVGKLLDNQNIKHETLDDMKSLNINGVLFEAIEGKHEFIYHGWQEVQNIGFFIAEKLFYPGDSFKDPKKKVDILALPVAGPWCRVCDAVDYALKVKPRVAFPVHDGGLKTPGGNIWVPSKVLPEHGIKFEVLEIGKEKIL